MSKRNKAKIITRTNSKTIIRHGELVRILNATEIKQWHHILEKIRLFEVEEDQRAMKED